MRKTIPRRLSESKRTIPQFYASIELDVTGITSHRLRFRQSGVATPSLNDYLLFATSRALVEESAVNSLWGEDGITKCKHSNIGIATTTRRGLYVPVLANADTLSLQEISISTKLLAEKVAKGSCSAEIGRATCRERVCQYG